MRMKPHRVDVWERYLSKHTTCRTQPPGIIWMRKTHDIMNEFKWKVDQAKLLKYGRCCINETIVENCRISAIGSRLWIMYSQAEDKVVLKSELFSLHLSRNACREVSSWGSHLSCVRSWTSPTIWRIMSSISGSNGITTRLDDDRSAWRSWM